ncbi:hypothetical protein [Paenibacillus sp. sgz302251]|uniref:hypothetical protein n=1 Tax=Paenibacillus sp. sgz302251 TaxID=3414493 RepID=UPI003C7C23AE
MDMSKASNAQLNEIIHHSRVATLADKAAARNEQIRRSRKRSGKVAKHSRKGVVFK